MAGRVQLQTRCARAVEYAVETLERRLLLSASMIKDLEGVNGGSGPRSLVDLNGTVFFRAYEPATGVELYKSDGTAAGTVRITDIGPGNSNFDPAPMAAVGGGRVVMSAGVGGLWSSDGTAAGTQQISAVAPATNTKFVVAGGKMFYRASANGAGNELWVSDGTAAGTFMVKDINPGTADGVLTYDMAASGGVAYFLANDGTHGIELWRSDGTDAGTFMIQDINPGSANGADYYVTAAGGTVYFTATNGTQGVELWKTGGVLGDAQLVADINAGTGSSSPAQLSAVGSTLYFWAATPAYGMELYKTNGTGAGTVLVKDITAGTAGSTSCPIYDLNGAGYFWLGGQLWKTNGTDAGTVVVHAGPFNVLTSRSLVARGGSALVFVSRNGTTPELWRTDGTTAGTMLVSSPPLTPPPQYQEYQLTASNDSVYFSAKPADISDELYKLANGTTAATLVKDINTITYGSDTVCFMTAGSYTYFLKRNTTYRVWRTDGTAAGTIELFDTGYNPYSGAVNAWNAMPFGDSLLFTLGGKVWVTGSTPGTQTQLFSTGDYYLSITVVAGDKFYFAATEPAQNYRTQLWASDSSTVWSLAPVTNGGYTIGGYTNMGVMGGVLYFAGADSGTNSELWRTDGTPAGTYLLKEIRAGANGSFPVSMYSVNGKLLFSAIEDDGVRHFWTTDGTPEGTVRADVPVKPLDVSGAGTGYIRGEVVGNALYFTGTAEGASSPIRLWRTDGTAAGTRPIALPPGAPSVEYITEMQAMGSKLYFTLSKELFVTDGTDAGTISLCPYIDQNTTPDISYSYRGPQQLTPVGGLLYFAAGDNVRGLKLWRTDGTPIGTVLAEDMIIYNPSTYIKRVSQMAVLGDSVILGANDGLHGFEPWIAHYDGEPTADAGTGYQVLEGQSITVSGASSRAGASPIVKYEWDLDFSGIFNVDATGITASVGNLDGPKTHVVALRVTDSAGRTHVDIARVSVINVPPILAISGDSGPITEGSTYTLNLASLGDPAPDTIKSWQIAWGDGTDTTVDGNPGSVSHVYTNGPMRYFISASATDEDGTYTTRQVAVGVLDTTFATGGVMVQRGSLADARVAVAPDGRIVAVGGGPDFEVDRYLDTGTPDPSFGTAGHVAVDLTAGGIERASALALYDDGRILVGGVASSGTDDWLLARFLANGQLDPSFGSGGIVRLDLSADAGAEISDIILLPGGRILVGGSLNQGPSMGGLNFAAARFLETGQPDASFGAGGVATVDFGGTDRLANLALQSSGNIILGGTSNYGAINANFALARLTPDGLLRSGPSYTPLAAGKFIVTLPHYVRAEAMAMAIQNDDRILLAGGGLGSNSHFEYTVVRFLRDGALDTTFGNSSGRNGQWYDYYTGGQITALGLTPSGQINIFSTYLGNGPSLGRLTPLGMGDVKYGSSGITGGYFNSSALELAAPGSIHGAFTVAPDGNLIMVVTGKEGATIARITSEPADVFVDVTNIDPAGAYIGPDQSCNESQKVSFTATFYDPGTDPWVYRWHVTSSNGQVIPDGDAPTFNFTPNDEGVYTVEYTISDEGGSSTATATVTVSNVAPTVELGSNKTTTEGATVSIKSVESDPGPVDVLTRSWTIQYPDGSIVDGGAAQTLVFTPPDNGVYTITVTVNDGDGGGATDSLTVTASNVAPTVTIDLPSALFAGDTFTLTMSATDPGQDTISAWTVNWGNGQIVTYGPVSSVQKSYSAGTSGRITISVSPRDEDGLHAGSSRTIFVSPRPTLSGSVLTINGTSIADTVFVTAASDTLIVAVNGAIASYTLSAITQVNVSLLDGDDALTYSGPVPGGSIDLGNGNDNCTLDTGDSASPATVLGGAGNDNLRLNAGAARSVNYQGGTGSDWLFFYGTDLADAMTITAVSTSSTSAAQLNPKSVTLSAVEYRQVNAGAGNDAITLIDSSSLMLDQTLNGDDGDDVFIIGDPAAVNSWTGRANLNGNAGNDSLTYQDQSSAQALSYTLYTTSLGRASQYLFYTSTIESITLNAGAAADQVIVFPGSAASLTVNGNGPTRSTSPADRLSVPSGSIVTLTAPDSGRYTYSDPSILPVYFTGIEQLGAADTVKPTIRTAAFHPGDDGIEVAFSENILGSVDTSDLQVTDLATGQLLPAGAFTLSVTGDLLVPTSARWVPAAPLPNGNYRARIVAAGLVDPSGNVMSADSTLDFFVLHGDANRDRVVDFLDLVAVAQNYNTPTGATLGQGDLNGDGAVNFIDLVSIAQNYNASVPAPLPAPPAPAVIETDAADPAAVASPAAALANSPAAVASSSAARANITPGHGQLPGGHGQRRAARTNSPAAGAVAAAAKSGLRAAGAPAMITAPLFGFTRIRRVEDELWAR